MINLLKNMKFSRPNWVEIDINKIKGNVKEISKLIGSKTKIIAIIKDNGYGHGAAEIAKSLLKDNSVWGFGVASNEEGITLRENGITKPILLLGEFYPRNYLKESIQFNLTPTIVSFESLEFLSNSSLKASPAKPVKFHLKIDTGMGRIGILPSDVSRFIDKLKEYKNLKMEGVFTHFASADCNVDYTLEQINEFKRAIKSVNDAGIKNVLFHAANSAALIKYPSSHFSLVRPGIALYGLMPFKGVEKFIKLQPALSWKTKIVFIKKVPIGKSISYGCTFTARRNSLIATFPAGYGDGYNRKLSNCGSVIINNHKAPVVGRVTMDLTMADVTDVPGAQAGDEVILIGSSENGLKITADNIAEKCGTIDYEIVCNINQRVPRIYVK
ncbi:MAG: alanine racemase [Elusimicrobia bacterium]|nr:alanine racemase [Elusimicrobiota bacterium]MBU2615026.1 alanine racemase [Elusimicrobiota bacterium]